MNDRESLIDVFVSGADTLRREETIQAHLELARRPVEEMGDPQQEELSQRVAYVFQNPEHQFVSLTVYDELAFSLRARKVSESRIRELVEPMLALRILPLWR